MSRRVKRWRWSGDRLGKSTTMSLLHRVFDPQFGRITIDGTDIRDMTLAGLRRNIGVVFQEPMLFARSIEENVKIGKLDASRPKSNSALDRRRPTNSSPARARGSVRSSANAAARSPAANASGSPSPARC